MHIARCMAFFPWFMLSLFRLRGEGRGLKTNNGYIRVFIHFSFSTSKSSYELYRLKKYKEQPPVGPRIPNVNIEGNHRFKDDPNFCYTYPKISDFECPEEIRKIQKTNDEILGVLRRKLPSSLMDKLTKTNEADIDTVKCSPIYPSATLH